MSQTPPNRVWPLLVLVVLIPLLPWLAAGFWFEPFFGRLFTDFQLAKDAPWWIAPAGLLVLALDSFLPVPATLVMSALGYALGVLLGGLVASLGLLGSGLVAYAACRFWGRGLALRIAGEGGLERVRGALEAHGPLLIAATRSVPVLQEAASCLAGLGGLPFRAYLGSLLLGCLPAGLAYAAIGASALSSPGLAVVLSLAVPLLSWPLVWWVVRRRRVHGGAPGAPGAPGRAQ